MVRPERFCSGSVASSRCATGRPISTAASAQVCAGMRNFRILELQWGETPWRAELLDPPEQFEQGAYAISNRPGIGARLNQKIAGKYGL